MMDMMSVNMALSHDSTVDRDGGVRRCAHVCGWMVGREKDKISTNNACIDVMTLAATATTSCWRKGCLCEACWGAGVVVKWLLMEFSVRERVEVGRVE
jgi:hypothetical protein